MQNKISNESRGVAASKASHYFVLMALFSGAIKRDDFSLGKLIFMSVL